MTSQGKQRSELFCLFSEKHTIEDAEYKKSRALPYFVSFWVPQHHPHNRDKQGFKGYICKYKEKYLC